MLTQRKTYERPELVRRGDIEDVTQGWGSIGSGDLIFQVVKGGWGTQEGCTGGIDQVFCTGS